MRSNMVAQAHIGHKWTSTHVGAHPSLLGVLPNMLESKQHIWIYFLLLINSDTLSKPNIFLGISLRPHTSPSIFYTNSIYIILCKIQLKISQRWHYILVSYFHKKTRLIDYKYIMNPSNSIFIIFSSLTFLAYIFSCPIYLKYYCTFSLYKVTNLNIQESPHLLNEIFCGYLVITLTY
jgi:hypothetical protein